MKAIANRLLRTFLLHRILSVLVLLTGLLLGGLLFDAPAGATTATRAATDVTASTAVGHRQVIMHELSTPRLAPAVGPTAPKPPKGPSKKTTPGTVSVNVDPKPSTSVTVLLLLTVLSLAPSIILLMTSFTKIFVVLSITRNALGLTGVPPNQVLAGLSMFLSLFIMGPTVKKVNADGIQPYLKGTKSQTIAFNDGIAPLRQFMLQHTRHEEIALMLRAGHLPNPASIDKLDLTTLIPAFVLSELRSAMIIGFVIYIPFLIIDMVVASSLMSLGMMMLPPVSVSLPFKLLLFVLVDGWGLIINALVHSYGT
ncbi:MAG TPA: flagellar type III secretion system pore protein FliP [Jatrophihabitans sp.]|jgi:flagellar biosynthetic protein FliP